jgi:CHAT domain-containing protein/tetratricopeptide (TPR) repeat protein
MSVLGGDRKCHSQAESAVTPARKSSAAVNEVNVGQNAFAEAERLRAEQREALNQRAIEKYKEAAELWHRDNQLEKAAQALRNAGEVYLVLGQTEDALQQYKESLALSSRTRNQHEESKARNDLGYLYFIKGNSAAALENCLIALKLAKATGDREVEAQALSNIGESYFVFGDLTKALNYQRQALDLWQVSGNRLGQSQAYTALGFYYRHLSDPTKALAAYQQALSLAREVHDARAEALALIATGNLKSKLGDKQAALDSYKAAKPITEQIGDRIALASVYGGLGAIYAGLGDQQKALEHAERALQLFEATGGTWGTAEVKHEIGRAHHFLGENDKALKYLKEALSLSQSLSMPRLQLQTLYDIGLVYSSMDDTRSALNAYQQSLRLTRAGQDQRHEAYTLDYIGEIYEKQKDSRRALAYYEQALPLSRNAGDTAVHALTLYHLAHLERDQSHFSRAQQLIEEATKIHESLRGKVSSEDLRASYFATARQTYELYIDILMQQQKSDPHQRFAAQGFEVSERARARSFLESLQESQADIKQGVNPELLRQQKLLEETLNAKAEQQLQLLQKNQKVEAESVGKELEQLTASYDELTDQIKATSPRYAALTSPQPLNLEQIQDQVLDDNTLLLAYTLGDDRSYAWVVGKSSLAGYELPPRAEIEAAAGRLYELITAYQALPKESLEQRLQRQAEAGRLIPAETTILSKMVLGPFAGTLGKKRLLIIPDGALQYIPFRALNDPDDNSNGVALINNHEVANELSASTLALLVAEAKGRQSQANTVAVLADPVFEIDDPRLNHGSQQTPSPTDERLKLQQAIRDIGISSDGVEIPRLFASGEEAEAIMATVPWGTGLKAVGFEATRERVLGQELAQYRIVHFATHGLINNQHPELSGIVLSLFDRQGKSRDGFLRLHDIYNLRLPADLVVLSACSTGLGKDVKGEGLIGLTRGFMYAGASGVVASLWKVDDDATAVLMKGFYEAMFKKGLSPAAALRDSQLAMARQEKWRAPYYWAGFIIQGQTDTLQIGRGQLFLTRQRWILAISVAGGLVLASILGLRRRRKMVV